MLKQTGALLAWQPHPVISPEELNKQNPDAVLVLPWNLINELSKQLPGYKLFTAIPSLTQS